MDPETIFVRQVEKILMNTQKIYKKKSGAAF